MNKLAKIKDLDFIFEAIKNSKFFKYLRKDRIENMIKNYNVIFDSGIIILFIKYKKKVKLSNISAVKNSYRIYHIVITKLLGDKLISKIMDKFCYNKTIFIMIDSENIKMIDFYKRNKFIEISKGDNIILLRKNQKGISYDYNNETCRIKNKRKDEFK